MTLHERIREMLEYNPDTGEFRWKKNVCNVKRGSIAGSKLRKGYLNIRVNRKQYLAHRLAWFWMTGKWPPSQIDHINMIKDDNRWSNLRLAVNEENHLNRSKNKNNTSGYKGVSFSKKNNKFVAVLSAKKCKKSFLGYFDNAEDAHKAYSLAIRNFNASFGRSS